MNVVIAAIDNSAAARPVLEVARTLAVLLHADVEALHVEEGAGAGGREPSGRTAQASADALHIPFHLRRGDVAAELAATVHERDAIAAVIGARNLPSGAMPAGHVTLDLVQMLDVAVAVVPPNVPARPLQRVLVAVEGEGNRESPTLRSLLRLGVDHDHEIVALHVFEPDTLPPFGDEPALETEAWIEEFRQRSLRTSRHNVTLEVRVGDAAHVVWKTAHELGADLVVLAWKRQLEGGHGRLVRHTLENAQVPVLLLPTPRRVRTRRQERDVSASG